MESEDEEEDVGSYGVTLKNLKVLEFEKGSAAYGVIALEESLEVTCGRLRDDEHIRCLVYLHGVRRDNCTLWCA